MLEYSKEVFTLCCLTQGVHSTHHIVIEMFMKQFIFLLFLLCEKVLAQTATYTIAPLSHINNYWVYEDNYVIIRTTTIRIIDTAKYIDSIKYVEVLVDGIQKILYRLREDGFYVMRRDTSYPEPNYEQIYYKKDAKYGEQWEGRDAGYPPILYFTIVDTAQTIVFGKNITIKLLNIRNDGLLDRYEIWSEEFGMLSEERGEGFTYNLKGCLIDNVLYGDTTFTSVDRDKNIVFSYSLSQNYPNPFNSTTTIEYEIYSQTYVRITIFNSIGESILSLVNEVQLKGKYKIKFNADNLPSGVYFYRLTDGKKSITNKMLILK